MFNQHNARVSEHLPFDARTQLVRASQTPITSGDLLARARAIEEASTRIRYQYPHFFKKEAS